MTPVPEQRHRFTDDGRLPLVGDAAKPLEQFGPDELEARHKLLFKMIGIIWA
jgi:hypothetical protein